MDQLSDIDKYLDLNDEQIDSLLLNVDLNVDMSKKSNDKGKHICKNCKSKNLVYDNGKAYMVCTDCAVINDQYLDCSADMSNNEDGAKTSCYGGASSYYFPKSSLGTKIVSKGYNRLSLLQKQGQMPYKEKSLMDVLEVIQAKCRKYNITNTIIDTAKLLYKKVSESVHNKGKRKGKNIIMRCINRRSMIAACIFHACKLQKETRSPKEIADIYDLEIKHVNRGCRKFCDIIDSNTLFYQIKSSQSTDFIERFATKLNIDKKFINISKDVSNNIHKLDLASTHEPPSVAAGCLLLVATYYNIKELNKKQISDIFGISDVTISKTFRKIWPYRKIIINNTITDLILEKKKSMTITNNIEKSNLIMSIEENEIEKNKNKKKPKNKNIINEDSDEVTITDISDSESSEDEEEKEEVIKLNKKNTKSKQIVM